MNRDIMSRMRLQWTLNIDDSWIAFVSSEKDWKKPVFDASQWPKAVVFGGAGLAPWNIAEVVAKKSTLLSPATLPALQDVRLRASLLPQDQLQSVLGHPHRKQIVSHRESLTTMLETFELTNGSALDEQLLREADHWLRESGSDPSRLIGSLYSSTLGREPTSRKYSLAAEYHDR